MRRVLHEPTLWFALLGAALFALWQVVGTAEDPDRIVVTEALVDSLQAQHVQQTGDLPDEATLEGLIRDWVEREALYREALALGMDDHDPILKRRMVQKLSLALADLATAEEPDDEELQAWLDAHPDRYAQPAAYAFTHVFVDTASPDEVLEALRDGTDPEDVGAPFRVPPRQPLRVAEAHARSFGAAFASALPSLEEGVWTPVQSTYGTHLVRLDEVRPGHPATLDEVRQAVARDLRAERVERARAKAVDRIVSRYEVESP